MKKLITVAAFSLMSFGANAELVDTNWLSEGDKRATLDTNTGLEWLKTDETLAMSVNDINNAMESTLSGWRWATRDEVFSLFASNISYIYQSQIEYGNTIDGVDRSQDKGWETLDFIEKLGGYSNHESYFFVKKEGGNALDWIHLDTYWQNSYYSFDLYDQNFDLDYRHASTGHFLVSDGGTTLSSKLDPTINIKNPDAPINQVTQVSVPFFMSGGLALLFIGLRRRG